MALSDILTIVESYSGISSPDLNAEQRTMMINYVNRAAKEIWESKDLPGCLMEVYVHVNADRTIALPPFVDKIRGVRNQYWDGKMASIDMRPRYSRADWETKWDKVRIIGYSAIAIDLESEGPITIEYPEADPTLTFTIKGETSNSNNVADVITMTTATKAGVKSFIDVNRIVKNRASSYNATIKDSDGNEIGILFADQLESKYLIVDISAYPNLQQCSDGTYILEVLYKPLLPILKELTDEFPIRNFDDIIALRTMQLLTEREEGKESRALMMYEKSQDLIAKRTQDDSGHTLKRFQHRKHPAVGMFRNSKYYY